MNISTKYGRSRFLLSAGLIGGLAILAGCSSHQNAAPPAPVQTAAAPNPAGAPPQTADASGPAGAPVQPAAAPNAPAAPQAFQPYTVVNTLPPKPKKVVHKHRRLHLALYHKKYYLADDSNRYYPVARDKSGHIYPVTYDIATHRQFPLFYDPDRDRYYRVIRDEDNHVYRNYEGDRDDVCYHDDRDDYRYREDNSAQTVAYYNVHENVDDEDDYYRHDDYDRPVIVAPAHHDPNRDAWLLAIPVVVGAYFLLKPRHHSDPPPVYQTPPGQVRYLPGSNGRPGADFAAGRPGAPGQSGPIVINNNQNVVVQQPGMRGAPGAPATGFRPGMPRTSFDRARTAHGAAVPSFGRAAHPATAAPGAVLPHPANPAMRAAGSFSPGVNRAIPAVRASPGVPAHPVLLAHRAPSTGRPISPQAAARVVHPVPTAGRPISAQAAAGVVHPAPRAGRPIPAHAAAGVVHTAAHPSANRAVVNHPRAAAPAAVQHPAAHAAVVRPHPGVGVAAVAPHPASNRAAVRPHPAPPAAVNRSTQHPPARPHAAATPPTRAAVVPAHSAPHPRSAAPAPPAHSAPAAPQRTMEHRNVAPPVHPAPTSTHTAPSVHAAPSAPANRSHAAPKPGEKPDDKRKHGQS